MLFAHAVHGGVGFDRSRVHRLRIARDQLGGHALGKDVVKEVLEHSSRIELASAAFGGVPGQVFVDFVAEKIEDVEPQATMLDEPAVTDQVFQSADQ
jgi:hypothetical protein